jgi:hypothetical protein
LSHVFLSYVHDDSADVDRLVRDLAGYGIDVWLDRNEIEPGRPWKDAIRHAIQEGNFFVACFSAASASRDKSYMNEELAVAIEQFRQFRRDRIWFIPVLLTDSEVPDWPIRPGETLRDLQWVELFRDWEVGVGRIATVVAPEAVFAGYVMPELDEAGWEGLLRSIARDRCLLVLGPGINSGLASRDADVASALAAKHDLITDSKDLPGVLRFLSEYEGLQRAAKALAEVLAPSPEFDDPKEMHVALAELPLSLYLTTTYDTYMEEALRRRGRTPVEVTWSLTEHRWISAEDGSSGIEPNPATPWVVHLRGAVNRPDSLILSLGDQFRLLVALLYQRARGSEPRFLKFQEAFEAGTHVFLGHRLDDWTTQLVSEGLFASANRDSRLIWGTYDISPELLVPHANALPVRTHAYFSKFFDRLGFPIRNRIPIDQFVGELHTRWVEFTTPR